MTPFSTGFADELVKVAGKKPLAGLGMSALKRTGRLAIKHPLISLGVLGTGATTLSAASKGFKSGLKGGEKARYLHASKRGPSRAAYGNYHQLFEHKPDTKHWRERPRWKLHRHYREEAFK